MKIDRDFVKKIAELSRIKLSEKELTKFPDQFKTILATAETLKKVDLKGLNSQKFDHKSFSTLRADIVEASQPKEDLLKTVNFTHEGFVKVPGTTFGDEE